MEYLLFMMIETADGTMRSDYDPNPKSAEQCVYEGEKWEFENYYIEHAEGGIVRYACLNINEAKEV